jgi:hypothetical protein
MEMAQKERFRTARLQAVKQLWIVAELSLAPDPQSCPVSRNLEAYAGVRVCEHILQTHEDRVAWAVWDCQGALVHNHYEPLQKQRSLFELPQNVCPEHVLAK